MIDNFFNEQLGKNRVLTNKSNKEDIVHYEYFSGSASLDILAVANGFGSFNIEIQEVEAEVSIYYNNGLLLKTGECVSRHIPCLLDRNGSLKIVGVCKGIKIYLDGGVFVAKPRKYLLPMLKNYVCEGGNKILYAYENESSILNMEYTQLSEISNCEFVQTYFKDFQYYIAKLAIASRVYLTTSIDNYTKSTIITDNADSIIFLQNAFDGKMYFVKIFDNSLTFITMNANGEIYNEETIEYSKTSIPVALINSSSEFGINRFFAVKFSDGYFVIFTINGSGCCEQIWQIKADNLKLHETSENLIVSIFKDYGVEIHNFVLNFSNSKSDMLQEVTITKYSNVIDCDIVGGKPILVSTGFEKFLGDVIE